jgi:hypothetical protein
MVKFQNTSQLIGTQRKKCEHLIWIFFGFIAVSAMNIAHEISWSQLRAILQC